MWRGQTKLQENVDVADLVRAVRRGLPVTLVIALAVGLLTFGVLSLMPAKHVAEVRLAISTLAVTPATGGQANGGASDEAIDRDAMSRHVRAIAAPELLSRVADDLRLAKYIQSNGGDGGVVGAFDERSCLPRRVAPRRGHTRCPPT